MHVRNLARALAARDCEVHVFCGSSGHGSYREGGVTVHKIKSRRPNVRGEFSQMWLEYYLFESEVVRALIGENAKRPFDILHTHGFLTGAAFIVRTACGTKWIHTFHAVERSRVRKLSREEESFTSLISWLEDTVRHLPVEPGGPVVQSTCPNWAEERTPIAPRPH
ncbi:MAG: glycosyltransferase [archaeon]